MSNLTKGELQLLSYLGIARQEVVAGIPSHGYGVTLYSERDNLKFMFTCFSYTPEIAALCGRIEIAAADPRRPEVAMKYDHYIDGFTEVMEVYPVHHEFLHLVWQDFNTSGNEPVRCYRLNNIFLITDGVIVFQIDDSDEDPHYLPAH